MLLQQPLHWSSIVAVVVSVEGRCSKMDFELPPSHYCTVVVAGSVVVWCSKKDFELLPLHYCTVVGTGVVAAVGATAMVEVAGVVGVAVAVAVAVAKGWTFGLVRGHVLGKQAVPSESPPQLLLLMRVHPRSFLLVLVVVAAAVDAVSGDRRHPVA